MRVMPPRFSDNPISRLPQSPAGAPTGTLPRSGKYPSGARLVRPYFYFITSGRVKVIPFERHFTAKERDHGLKGLFRKNANKSAIPNWLLDGYRLMLEVGMDVSERMQAALDEYRSESDLLGGLGWIVLCLLVALLLSQLPGKIPPYNIFMMPNISRCAG